jgi:hypothetical protein
MFYAKEDIEGLDKRALGVAATAVLTPLTFSFANVIEETAG